MLRRHLVLLPVLLIAACGTPQEQCIRRTTSELRTVERLISESEINLARGYGYVSERIVRHEWVMCGPMRPGLPPRRCFEPVEDTIRRPVAIDPDLELRKLDNLRAKQASLTQRAEKSIAACRVSYPEES